MSAAVNGTLLYAQLQFTARVLLAWSASIDVTLGTPMLMHRGIVARRLSLAFLITSADNCSACNVRPKAVASATIPLTIILGFIIFY